MIDEVPNDTEQANDRLGLSLGVLAPANTVRGVSSSLNAPWAGQRISFPDVIETMDDTPVLLSCLVDMTGCPRGEGSGLRIIGINGIDTSAFAATPLPGIRVGDGEGSGYVFRRGLDGQLVFAPDAGYTGVTTFVYTVADATGDVASVIATVSVGPTAAHTTDIAFTDGTQWASVPEGVDAAIIGSLDIAELGAENRRSLQVYEGEANSPSSRFAVSGDKLWALKPLDHTEDGAIQLRIVADDTAFGLASSAFTIEVRSARSALPLPVEIPSTAYAMRPTLAYSASQPNLEEAGARDRFHFKPDSEAGLETVETSAPFDATTDGVAAVTAAYQSGELPEISVPLRIVTPHENGDAPLPPSDGGDFGGF